MIRKLLFVLIAFHFTFAQAQERIVKGKVTGEDGTELPGVSVVIKGTSTGTITNASGEYSISASPDAILTFSFIGYKTIEQTVAERSILDVKMENDITQLGEVIVTAVGIERDTKTLGYSVANIKSDYMNQSRVTNLAAALSAKVSGLQINQTSNSVNGPVRVVLRGNRSFLGNNQALVVLDGVQVSSDYLNSINPNDVDNVTVLKGATAAALYGSTAANGVLVINTKSGKRNSAPEINISSTTQIEKVSYLPKLQQRFGSFGGETLGSSDVYSIDPNFPAGYVGFENQSFGPQFNGQLVPVGRPLADGSIYYTPYSSKYNDKLKFWNTGVTQQNDASLSAGDDKSTYFVSYQDVHRSGVVPKDTYSRNTFRFNGSRQYGIFKIGYRLTYGLTHQDRTSAPGTVYNDWMNVPMQVPLTQLADWQHNKFANPTGYFNDFYNNPYFDLDQNRFVSNQQDFLGNIELSLQPTKWLNLLGRAGLTSQSYQEQDNTMPLVFDPTMANINKYMYFQGNGNLPPQVSNTTNNTKRINTDFLATINHDFSEDTHLKLILGNNIFDDYFTTSNIGSTNLLYLNPVIYNVAYRNGNISGSTYQQRYRKIGLYGDLTFTHKFITLHGSYRNDWTSLLNSNNWSFSYPEVDAAFVITDAFPSLKEGGILSFAKITGSLAAVGNVSLNPYQLQNPFNAATPYYTNGPAPVLFLGQTAVQQNIKPEFTAAKETTLELGFLEGKLNFKTAYYQTNTTNQTVSFQVSNAAGYPNALINTGEMLNRGLEFDLNYTPISTSSGFKWTVGANFTELITNTPLSIYKSPNGTVVNSINVSDNNGNSTNSWAIIGQQYPVVKGIDYLRDKASGKVIVDPITGMPSQDPNQKVMGQANPKHRLGLNTMVSYKGFSLSVLFDYRAGNVIYNQMGQNLLFGGIDYNSAQAGRQRFVFPNSVYSTDGGHTYVPNTNITINDGNYNFWQNVYYNVTSNFITSGAFWKLREVNFSYQLPKSFLGKTKFIKAVKASIIGRNLLMWRPASNVWTDPEFSSDTSNALGTTNVNQTPPTRTYGFVLAFTF
ncbi:MAG: SusC/RagA family TonB-linked outer membrane protein [Bacteroidetes bacterium]|nr:SusC/RagA family TonB-linked outer membrane protein [Bacteroidota bacterium]MBS1541033.1 SusC/RagA family TonB-linked outer membrane protein [Bacteroidota bacterium]